MRKIVVQMEISQPTEGLSCEHLRKQLQQFGDVRFDVLEDVELASGKDARLTCAYWIFVPADEELPYMLVSGPREVDGVEIPQEVMRELTSQAVCTEFHADYPRGDRYGAPRYAASSSFAEAVVSEHFMVASEGLEVDCRDRGDDGAEEIWLLVKSKDMSDRMPALPAVASARLGEAGSGLGSDDEEEPHRFRNFYVHKDCPKQPGVRWDSTWSCMCNDHCPACDAEIEPESSEDLDDEGEAAFLAEAGADGSMDLRVSAAAHTDDRVIEVAFDCTAWFQQASHEDVMRLANCGWEHDYPADEVTQFMADRNDDAKSIFSYLDLVHKAKKECGFECEVNSEEAMAWLKVNKQSTWAKLLCEKLEVRVFQSPDEETLGRWDWNDDRGNGSEISFETESEAALNAVAVLNLESASQG